MQATTKTCPHCKSEINIDAKKCPQCQSDLRNWFARHKILTALLIIIGLPIVIGIAAGATSDARKKSAEIQNQSNTQAPAPTQSAPDWQSMKVGDEGYLRLPDNNDSNQNICLGKTTKDADAISQALLAKDYVGLLEIPGAFCVGNGSKVLLIEKSFPYRKVRMLAGVKEVDNDKVGMSGYAPAEWVVNK